MRKELRFGFGLMAIIIAGTATMRPKNTPNSNRIRIEAITTLLAAAIAAVAAGVRSGGGFRRERGGFLVVAGRFRGGVSGWMHVLTNQALCRQPRGLGQSTR